MDIKIFYLSLRNRATLDKLILTNAKKEKVFHKEEWREKWTREQLGDREKRSEIKKAGYCTLLYIVFTFIMSDVFLFISFSIFYTIFYSSSFFISFILNIASINAITNIELSVAETLGIQ